MVVAVADIAGQHPSDTVPNHPCRDGRTITRKVCFGRLNCTRAIKQFVQPNIVEGDNNRDGNGVNNVQNDTENTIIVQVDGNILTDAITEFTTDTELAPQTTADRNGCANEPLFSIFEPSMYNILLLRIIMGIFNCAIERQFLSVFIEHRHEAHHAEGRKQQQEI